MILEKVVRIRGQETRISDRFIFFLVESMKNLEKQFLLMFCTFLLFIYTYVRKSLTKIIVHLCIVFPMF